MAPLVGTGLQTANQMGAFKAEGGIVDFHEGGLAAHRGADHSHPENDPAVINMVIAVLQEQGHLPPGDQGRIAFMNKMQGDPNFRPLFDQQWQVLSKVQDMCHHRNTIQKFLKTLL